MGFRKRHTAIENAKNRRIQPLLVMFTDLPLAKLSYFGTAADRLDPMSGFSGSTAAETIGRTGAGRMALDAVCCFQESAVGGGACGATIAGKGSLRTVIYRSMYASEMNSLRECADISS